MVPTGTLDPWLCAPGFHRGCLLRCLPETIGRHLSPHNEDGNKPLDTLRQISTFCQKGRFSWVLLPLSPDTRADMSPHSGPARMPPLLVWVARYVTRVRPIALWGVRDPLLPRNSRRAPGKAAKRPVRGLWCTPQLRQPGDHGPQRDFRPMALRTRLSPGMPFSVVDADCNTTFSFWQLFLTGARPAPTAFPGRPEAWGGRSQRLR